MLNQFKVNFMYLLHSSLSVYSNKSTMKKKSKKIFFIELAAVKEKQPTRHNL